MKGDFGGLKLGFKFDCMIGQIHSQIGSIYRIVCGVEGVFLNDLCLEVVKVYLKICLVIIVNNYDQLIKIKSSGGLILDGSNAMLKRRFDSLSPCFKP